MTRPWPDDAFLALARRIRLLVLDVDGILTDGKLYYSNQGDEIKAFSILDGHGIKLLQRHEVRVALITGRQSAIVGRRAAELGIDIVHQNQGDKLRTLESVLDELGMDFTDTAYMGDDLPDLACLCRVALGITVPNGHDALKQRARYITTRAGGEGAVREVCDLFLQARGVYDALIESCL